MRCDGPRKNDDGVLGEVTDLWNGQDSLSTKVTASNKDSWSLIGLPWFITHGYDLSCSSGEA